MNDGMDIISVLGIVGGVLTVTISVGFLIARKVDKSDFIRAVDKLEAMLFTHVEAEDRKFEKIFEEFAEVKREIRNGNGK